MIIRSDDKSDTDTEHDLTLSERSESHQILNFKFSADNSRKTQVNHAHKTISVPTLLNCYDISPRGSPRMIPTPPPIPSPTISSLPEKCELEILACDLQSSLGQFIDLVRQSMDDSAIKSSVEEIQEIITKLSKTDLREAKAVIKSTKVVLRQFLKNKKLSDQPDSDPEAVQKHRDELLIALQAWGRLFDQFKHCVECITRYTPLFPPVRISRRYSDPTDITSIFLYLEDDNKLYRYSAPAALITSEHNSLKNPTKYPPTHYRYRKVPVRANSVVCIFGSYRMCGIL